MSPCFLVSNLSAYLEEEVTGNNGEQISGKIIEGHFLLQSSKVVIIFSGSCFNLLDTFTKDYCGQGGLETNEKSRAKYFEDKHDKKVL